MNGEVQARRNIKKALDAARVRWEFSAQRDGAGYKVVFRRGTTIFTKVIEDKVVSDARSPALQALVEEARRVLED